MNRAAFRRAGAYTAISGAVAALVGNIVHPRYSGDDVDTYRSIASSSRFRTADVFIILAFLLVAAAMMSFARIWGVRRAEALGYYGRFAAAVGGTLGLVGIAIETYAFKEQAHQFVTADGRNIVSAFWATNALDHVDSALLDITTVVLLGIAPCLIAAAQLLHRNDAPRLSITGLAGGAVCAVTGVIGLLVRDQSSIDVPFLVGSLLVTLWVFATGLHLARTPGERVVDVTDQAVTAEGSLKAPAPTTR